MNGLAPSEIILILVILVVPLVTAVAVLVAIVVAVRDKKSTSTKQCPYCAELIRNEAIVCPFCGRDVAENADGKTS